MMKNLIGGFSSLKKANEVMNKYKNLEGFRDCPLTCFTVDEYEVDKTFNWAEQESGVGKYDKRTAGTGNNKQIWIWF